MFIVKNGLSAMDTPDDNGYVVDDYRIAYLEARIKSMQDAIYHDGVDLLGGAVSIWFQLEQAK